MSGRRAVDCYVYAVTDGPIVLYVGKGTGQRYRQSAKKHGGEGKILERFTCEKRAYKRERELIEELSPTENRCSGGGGGWIVNPRKPVRMSKIDRLSYKLMEELGTQVYVARWLLLNFDTIEKHVPECKLDISRLRQVAYGARA